MPRIAFALAALLAGAGLAFLATTTTEAQERKRCDDCRRERPQLLEGRFNLERAKGDEVVVLDSVTGAVYRTDAKTVTTFDPVGGRIITRNLEVVDQRGVIQGR